MSKRTYIAISCILSLIFASCSTDFIPIEVTVGDLNSTNIVVIGDDFLIGSSSGGLNSTKQHQSITRILVDQIREGATFIFNEPELPVNYNARWVEFDDVNWSNCIYQNSIPSMDWKQGSTDIQNRSTGGPFNNLAIPGLKLQDVLNTSELSQNPYLVSLFPEGSQNITYPALIDQSDPSFILASFGFNDIYSVAKNGYENASLLLPPSNFDNFYRELLDAIIGGQNVPGIIFNIPNVKWLPYFNGIQPKKYNTSECDGSYNPIYIEDMNGSVGEAGVNTLLKLDLGDEIETKGTSTSNYFSKDQIIDDAELAMMDQFINSYNESIAQIAFDYNLQLFDLNGFCRTLNNDGIFINGVELNSDIVFGSFYSEDGIYPSPRGNAVLANELIKLINGNYNASIPKVDPNQYSTVKLP